MTHKIYKLFGLKVWEVVGLGSEATPDQYKADLSALSAQADANEMSTSSAFASGKIKGEVLILTKEEEENFKI